MAEFDPYYEWLGIQPHERPVDHYRLLGLERFESDPATIKLAADQRVTYLRSLQSGPRGAYTQSLLNELAQASHCLLDGGRKAAYDQRLLALAPVAAPAPSVPLARPAASKREQSAPATSTAPATLPEPPPVAEHQGEANEEEDRSSSLWLPAALLASVLLIGTLVWAIVLVSQRDRSQSDRVAAPPSPRENPPQENSPTVNQGGTPRKKRQPDNTNRARAMQELDGSIYLSALPAQLVGDQLEFVDDGQGGVIRGWAGEGDEASWAIRVTTPSYFELDLTYATAGATEDTEMTLELGDQSKTIRLRESGGAKSFLTDTYYFLVRRSGDYVVALRAGETLGKPGLVVRNIRLRPKGK